MKYVTEYLSGMNLMELRRPSISLKIFEYIKRAMVRDYLDWWLDEEETEGKYNWSRQLATAWLGFRKTLGYSQEESSNFDEAVNEVLK